MGHQPERRHLQRGKQRKDKTEQAVTLEWGGTMEGQGLALFHSPRPRHIATWIAKKRLGYESVLEVLLRAPNMVPPTVQEYDSGAQWPLGDGSSSLTIPLRKYFLHMAIFCNHPQPGISVLKLIGEQDCSWRELSAHAL